VSAKKEERGENVAGARELRGFYNLKKALEVLLYEMKEGIKGEYLAFSEVLKNCTNKVR